MVNNIMPKRKRAVDSSAEKDEPRRSSRRAVMGDAKGAPPKIAKSSPVRSAAKTTGKPRKTDASKEDKKTKHSKVSNPSKLAPSTGDGSSPQTKPSPASPPGRQYWLMKAEPESRIEKGQDIKFSIDDLAAKTEPEPWDGIRAYPARNNLRAMKKGDLACFYHSSCKVPAIVGIMEIVEEHSPDVSAHDPSAPYYDPSSKPEDPKWSVVHVEFRQKLATPITLKELKAWQVQKGHPLENMQTLKLARISVSRVSRDEWEFLKLQMKERGDVLNE